MSHPPPPPDAPAHPILGYGAASMGANPSLPPLNPFGAPVPVPVDSPPPPAVVHRQRVGEGGEGQSPERPERQPQRGGSHGSGTGRPRQSARASGRRGIYGAEEPPARPLHPRVFPDARGAGRAGDSDEGGRGKETGSAGWTNRYRRRHRTAKPVPGSRGAASGVRYPALLRRSPERGVGLSVRGNPRTASRLCP